MQWKGREERKRFFNKVSGAPFTATVIFKMEYMNE